MQIQAPKGTKDVLPSESYKWQYVEDEIRKLCRIYGVYEFRTPIIEHTELFMRGVGDTTDIVQKEMYTFTDKGNRSITLKPEGTAGMARAFLENRLFNEAMPQKMYYLNAPVFRYEKPQAGRLREHHQFGVEFYGSASYQTDAEVILLAMSLLRHFGIGELALRINSIGCSECRKEYNKALYDYLKQHIDTMCNTCKSRLERNPMRIIDCKEEHCKEICKSAPRTIDYLCDDCKAHFEGLRKCLDVAGVKYIVDPDIVRGLDYYTGTVFEIVSTRIGSQGTVCGGGRYNNLIEELGGQPTPAVGFGLGLERLLMVMENNNAFMPKPAPVKVYFAAMGDKPRLVAFDLVHQLREHGVFAEFDHMDRSMKAQFKYANKLGAEYTAVLGEDELSMGIVKVKSMQDGIESSIAIDELVSYFAD